VLICLLPGRQDRRLGPNGSGKSTLLKIMAGIDKEFTGEAWARQGAKVGYLPQEPQLDPDNVFGNVMEGVAKKKAHHRPLQRADDELFRRDRRRGRALQDEIDAAEPVGSRQQVEMAMDALRCPPGDADVTNLSGGEKPPRRAVPLLLEKPDMLLLDEPTNHLDAETVAWLEKHLRDYPGLRADRHPRPLLPRQCHRLDSRTRSRPGIPYEGNYTAWLEAEGQALEQEGREEEAARRRSSANWNGSANRPRRARPSPRRVSRPMRNWSKSRPKTQPAPRRSSSRSPNVSAATVIEVDNLNKAFGDKLLIEDLSFKLPPGGIVGVIGPNGAGKTTLFRMITGQEKPDAARSRSARRCKLGYVDQSRDSARPNKTSGRKSPAAPTSSKLGKHEDERRAYVGAFNFKGGDQQKKVGQLSGGERNRVHLAKMLKEPAATSAARRTDQRPRHRNAARAGRGAGRFRRLRRDHQPRPLVPRPPATHILAFEGDSHVEWFEGNFEDYEPIKYR
jgi:ATPase subunit of ABC transporter with duplicated ATPase domains